MKIFESPEVCGEVSKKIGDVKKTIFAIEVICFFTLTNRSYHELDELFFAKYVGHTYINFKQKASVLKLTMLSFILAQFNDLMLSTQQYTLANISPSLF